MTTTANSSAGDEAPRVRAVFTPSGLETSVAINTSVLDAARALGVDVDSVCGGRGICGRCQVSAPLGTFDKWALTARSDGLTPPNETEANYRGKRTLKTGHRLGCQALIVSDVIIDVPPESQIHKQVVRKALRMDGVVLDPTVRLHYLEIPKTLLGDDATASQLIINALAEQWERHQVRVSPSILSELHPAMATDDQAVTVAVSTALAATGEVVAIWRGFVDAACGVAIDVGSTTVAGHLLDLATGEVLASAGRMNPQIRFGEDLMSRVSFVMMNPGGRVELTNAIRSALAELIAELLEAASRPANTMLSVTLVGNPVMHHLLLGIDPTPLGAAPFVLATADPLTISARSLDLPYPNATAYIGPCIAGHVGADTAAAILAEGPHRGETNQLLVDVGTNAEIVLGSRAGLFAASSPTGPAFEGAQLSCGVRATTGAIERVRIDPITLEPRFRVIGQEAWSDEDEFDHSRPVVGVCGSGIIEVMGEMFTSGVMDSEGVIRPPKPEHADRVVADDRTFSFVLHRSSAGAEMRITQNDVRAIQLAKAALRAGIDLLMEHAGVTEVNDIRLAGAFGAHIDPVYAVGIGLVPNGSRGADAVQSTGNSAGNGAVRMLLSGADRTEIATVVATQVTKIETATEPRFQDLFVDAMAFPHRRESPLATATGARRRRRRTGEGSVPSDPSPPNTETENV
ncbi:MAG: DUF4445 domain-containing protein [Acidimicrobiales bacterium]|nr:DUF4445 domain-containing protein [Acidimicrobiales bacterium]